MAARSHSLGYNLIDDSTCGTAGTGDIIGQTAQLGALGDNGGPTNTELPAIDQPGRRRRARSAVCTGTGVTTDQRGNARGAGPTARAPSARSRWPVAAPPAVNLNGYRLVANEGGIFDFGLNFHGSLANNHLNAPIVGIANSPGYDGYLMAGGDGGVFALGGANFYGSLGGQSLPSPISAIAAPPSENGYWLVAQNGKIYNFGAAPALPALSVALGRAHRRHGLDPRRGGAWLTDQLGDVYAEGDALYEGGLGGVHINAPIVGIAAAASGQGYVLAASDGGVFNYGTQGFFGSVPGSLAAGPVARRPHRRHRGHPLGQRATGWSVRTAASSTTATPRSWARSTPPSATTRSTGPSSGSSTSGDAGLSDARGSGRVGPQEPVRPPPPSRVTARGGLTEIG